MNTKIKKLNIDVRKSIDENIYSSNKKIKEIFKFTLDIICQNYPENINSILDVGCSNGSFLKFLKTKFPNANLVGLDVSKKLLCVAAKNVKNGKFINGSIEDKSCLGKNKYDLITMFGVIGILKDPKKSIINSVSRLNKGGRLYISSNFNENNIDVIMKYRRSDIKKAQWEEGWNIFSIHTISNILSKISKVERFTFYDFLMPFDIKKTDDPMRAWTTRVGNKSRYQINGAEQLLNRKVLEIKIKN